jgi:hypothetical protein
MQDFNERDLRNIEREFMKIKYSIVHYADGNQAYLSNPEDDSTFYERSIAVNFTLEELQYQDKNLS